MTKIFLTDVDGVVFDFIKTFEKWIKTTPYTPKYPHMSDDGHYFRIEEWLDIPVGEAELLIKDFFRSDYASQFVVYDDAFYGIATIKNAGYDIKAVTAIGMDEVARDVRLKTLNHHFDNAFSEVITTPPFDSKEPVLSQFAPTYWVDDTPLHATEGKNAGHYSFRMHREKDIRHTHDGTVEVNNWHDILDIMQTKGDL